MGYDVGTTVAVEPTMQTPELAAELTALLTEMREADRMAVVFATPVAELAGLGGPKLPVGDIGQRVAARLAQRSQ